MELDLEEIIMGEQFSFNQGEKMLDFFIFN